MSLYLSDETLNEIQPTLNKIHNILLHNGITEGRFAMFGNKAYQISPMQSRFVFVEIPRGTLPYLYLYDQSESKLEYVRRIVTEDIEYDIFMDGDHPYVKEKYGNMIKLKDINVNN